jgi:O-antigen/teichoic acid export membrane protein
MSSVPVSLTSRRTSRLSLAGGGAVVMGLRLATAAGMFALQVVLARALGVSGFGVYAFAMAWVQALAVFGRAGLDSTSLRQVAEYRTRDESALLAGYLHWSRRTSLLASGLTAAALILLAVTLVGPSEPATRGCLLLGAVALPLLTFRQIQEARLRAVHHVWQSLAGPAVWPLLLAALLLIVTRWGGWQATPGGAIGLQIVALGMCLAMTTWFVRCSPACRPLSTAVEMESQAQAWRKTALTFLAFDAVILLKGRTSVVIAGMLIDTDTAGIYAAAERFAEIVTLGVVSLNMFAAPHFASLHAAGRREELREMVRGCQFIGLLFAIPCAIVLALFGRPLLGLLDQGFVAGYPLLLILVGSVAIGSLSGPAAYVLAMSGGERTALHGAMLCMVVNLVLSFTLATFYGAMGLAITYLVTTIVWTVYMLWHLRQHLQRPAPAAVGG